jgi:addiction module HigA family antidote
MRMKNPPHPGEIIRELYLAPIGISVTEASKALNVTRKTMSAILNGRAGISSTMALRLAIAFKTSPDMWLNLQNQHDLWIAERDFEKVEIEILV